MKLSNKVALVTGGLKGIGRATVMELAMQGADIALNYRASEKNKVLAEELVKELKDLAKLPFTTKQDLRDYYPFDLFAADKKGYCKNTRIVGYNRQTDCSRLYKKRP